MSDFFDYQPTLAGDLVAVRPLAADDFAALLRVASDPLMWEQHPARDRWQDDVFRAFFDAGLESGRALLVMDRETGAVIGSSRYGPVDPIENAVEIGWTFLARSHWGGAYNRDLKRLMIGHALRFGRGVYFLVGKENVRSQRAVEKLGAVRGEARPDDSGHDSIIFRLDTKACRAFTLDHLG